MSDVRIKPKVYVNFNMKEEYVRRLTTSCDMTVSKNMRPSREELLDGVRDGVTAIVCYGWLAIDAGVLDAAGPSLKAICTNTAGYNHIDLAACKERNIRVGYVSNAMAGCMAEFTIGLMIATGRRFKEGMAELNRGGWEKWSPIFLNGFQISNSTVGIVGFGHIGQELAQQLRGFRVKNILYSGPHRKPEGDALGAEYTTFEDLLQRSDFVVAICALNDKTRGLFNRTAFGLMKPTSIFINVSRGGVVDQEALYEALTTNKIFAAGLDVAQPEPLPRDHPLVALENCVLLPHIGTSVKAVRDQIIELTLANVLAIVEGKPMPGELHF